MTLVIVLVVLAAVYGLGYVHGSREELARAEPPAVEQPIWICPACRETGFERCSCVEGRA